MHVSANLSRLQASARENVSCLKPGNHHRLEGHHWIESRSSTAGTPPQMECTLPKILPWLFVYRQCCSSLLLRISKENSPQIICLCNSRVTDVGALLCNGWASLHNKLYEAYHRRGHTCAIRASSMLELFFAMAWYPCTTVFETSRPLVVSRYQSFRIPSVPCTQTQNKSDRQSLQLNLSRVPTESVIPHPVSPLYDNTKQIRSTLSAAPPPTSAQGISQCVSLQFFE